MLSHEKNLENLEETLKIWELAKDFYHDSVYEAKKEAIKMLHFKNEIRFNYYSTACPLCHFCKPFLCVDCPIARYYKVYDINKWDTRYGCCHEYDIAVKYGDFNPMINLLKKLIKIEQKELKLSKRS